MLEIAGGVIIAYVVLSFVGAIFTLAGNVWPSKPLNPPPNNHNSVHTS